MQIVGVLFFVSVMIYFHIFYASGIRAAFEPLHNNNVVLEAAYLLTLPVFIYSILPLYKCQSIFIRWEAQKRELLGTLETFDIRNSKCRMERDRDFVYNEVAQVMEETNMVDPGADREHCLDVFNKCVQTEILRMVKRQLGHRALPYKASVIMGLPVIWYGLDTVSSDPTLQALAGNLLSYTVEWLWLFPLAANLFVSLAPWCTTKTRQLGVVVVVDFAVVALVGLLNRLGLRAAESTLILGGECFLAALFCAATVYVYWPRGRSGRSIAPADEP